MSNHPDRIRLNTADFKPAGPQVQFNSITMITISPKDNDHARFMLGLKKGQKAKPRALLIFGDFQTRKELNAAVLEELRDPEKDIWDLRTIKFHDGINFTPNETRGTVVDLEYVNDAINGVE